LRALITGGAGFIGSHLCNRLLADGHDVVAIDNLSTGRRENLPEHARLEFIEADCRDDDAYPSAEWWFHLAALADIVPSVEWPRTYHEANVDGTVAVLQAARYGGATRFIYAASSSCYGLPTIFPTPEDAPCSPQYPYALTKWIGEQYALHWLQVYGLPVVSLRLFNVYGPRQRTSGTYGAVLGVFLAQKANHQPFTVVGDGTQTRDFTHVSDVVDALMAAAESDVTGVFNVGSGSTQSVNTLVDLLGGPRVEIPVRPGEPDCTFADIRKIQSALGWRPQMSFQDGIAGMLEQVDQWQAAPVWTPETIAEKTAVWHRYLGMDRAECAQNTNEEAARFASPRRTGTDSL
jgi:UDP-glucose 4-epimerase